MTDSLHASAAADVAAALEVDPARGLAAVEIVARRARFGTNALVRERRRPAWRLFVRQFASVVVALLAGAAAVAFFTRDRAEAAAIVVVLLINALVGFLTEWQSQRALEKLRLEVHTTAVVRRDGVESIVDAAELVPGDVILLDAGAHVPADARLASVAGLAVDEAPLTGESLPVMKNASPSPATLPSPSGHRWFTSARTSWPDAARHS